MLGDVGIADQQKAEKQGRDDSCSVYNPTLHIDLVLSKLFTHLSDATQHCSQLAPSPFPFPSSPSPCVSSSYSSSLFSTLSSPSLLSPLSLLSLFLPPLDPPFLSLFPSPFSLPASSSPLPFPPLRSLMLTLCCMSYWISIGCLSQPCWMTLQT